MIINGNQYQSGYLGPIVKLQSQRMTTRYLYHNITELYIVYTSNHHITRVCRNSVLIRLIHGRLYNNYLCNKLDDIKLFLMVQLTISRQYWPCLLTHICVIGLVDSKYAGSVDQCVRIRICLYLTVNRYFQIATYRSKIETSIIIVYIYI